MKRLLYILTIALILPSCANQQQETTYPWEKEAEKQVSIISLADNLPAPQTCYFKRSSELCLHCLTEGDTILVYSNLPDSMIFTPHPLIDAVRFAYADHRPLVLSPDMVWLTIERGFAQHMEHNHSVLRNRIVGFFGKKKLTIESDTYLLDAPAEEWEPYIHQFSEQMKKWTKSELIQTLIADFSTTTPASYAASEVLIMSALQYYFEYKVTCLCGIPSIYLEGTQEDWLRLADKAHALRGYNLDWWLDELEPVLRKIADAAAGEVDRQFWQSILHKANRPEIGFVDCSMVKFDTIDGWILKLYPYISAYTPSDFRPISEIDLLHLVNTCGKAPLQYEELGGIKKDLTIYSGLVGISEDTVTHALRPEIAWFIGEEFTGKSSIEHAPTRYNLELEGQPDLTLGLYGEPCDEEIFEINHDEEKQEQIRRLDSIYSSDEEQLEINRAQIITDQLF